MYFAIVSPPKYFSKETYCR